MATEQRSEVGEGVSTVDMELGKKFPGMGSSKGKPLEVEQTWHAWMVWLEWEKQGKSLKN